MFMLMLLVGCSDYDLAEKGEDVYVEPDILVSPPSLAFGALSVGKSAQQTVTLTNQGDAALQVGALLVEGAAFSVLGVAAPFELPPGESLPVIVSYTAEAYADTGTLTVISSDPDSPEVAVPLMGGQQGPALLIEPPAQSFGDQMLGCSAEVAFTLTNIGNEALSLGDISAGGGFVVSEMPSRAELSPGQQVGLRVQFTPGDEKLYEGTLTVESNDPSGPGEAGLTGAGDDAGVCQALPLTFTVEHEVVDIAFILDTTTSMGSMANAMGAEFRAIAQELSDELDDVTFGAAMHRDYAPPIGVIGDLPFILLAQQTTDLDRVQTALRSIPLAGGGYDMPEASYEGLYQATTGKGYDQLCDGVYDASEDVLPYKRATDDAFGGQESGVHSSAVEGTGELGGMGFREGVLPIIILATDAAQKDADIGGPNIPGGCPKDAGASDVRAGLDALGARLIGVGVGWSTTSTAYVQLDTLADRMVTWGGGGSVKETIVTAVQDLISDITFDTVWLEVASDEHNQVDAIEPSQWEDVPTGSEVAFTLTVNSALVEEPRDDTYPVTVEVYGQIEDQQWLLDTHTFHVVEPE